jgi:hypothetical protein
MRLSFTADPPGLLNSAASPDAWSGCVALEGTYSDEHARESGDKIKAPGTADGF